jgi:hypothetical protein
MNQPAAAPQTNHFPPQFWTELSGTCLIASEALWIGLFYQALTQTASEPVLIVLVLAMIGLLSHYLARLSADKPGKARVRRVLSGIWIFFCLAMSAHLLYFGTEIPGLGGAFCRISSDLFRAEQRVPAFAHMLIVVMLIWRGVRLARSPITLGFSQTSFRLSAAAFLFFGTVYHHYLQPRSIVLFGLYLFLALSGMTFGRIAYLGQTRGGKLPPYGWSWLGKISIAVLGIVSVAVLTGISISGKAANTLATAVMSVLGAFAVAAAYILAPVMQVVIGFIMRLLERTPGSDLVVGPAMREGIRVPGEETANNEALLSNIVEILQALLPVGILIIVVVLILSSLGWKPWSRKPQAVEADTALIKPAKAHNQKETTSFIPGWVNPGRLLAAARIRRVYAQLMDLSARLENARPPAVTPLEFLPGLIILFPEERESVSIITNAYLDVRYGEVPEDPQAVQTVLTAWKQVNQKGRQLLAIKKAARRSRPRK